MTDDRPRILAITNAQAGTADDAAIETAVEVLRGGADVAVVATADADDLAGALRDHADRDRVVVLGGDGSLHAVVQVLHDCEQLSERTVGLIPLGTGNDFARALDIPLEPEAAAKVVLDGSVHELDLGTTDDGDVIVNAIHAGVGAEAAAAGAPLKKLLGRMGYALGSAIAGFTRPGVVVDVEVDGERVVAGERILQVAAGVGRFVGGGAELLPDADPADGKFDIAISTATPPLRRLTYTVRLRRGEHPHHADVHYLQGTSVTISGEPTRATNDGEVSDPTARHAWTLHARAWRFLAP